jgi:hypothetical protein
MGAVFAVGLGFGLQNSALPLNEICVVIVTASSPTSNRMRSAVWSTGCRPQPRRGGGGQRGEDLACHVVVTGRFRAMFATP